MWRGEFVERRLGCDKRFQKGGFYHPRTGPGDGKLEIDRSLLSVVREERDMALHADIVKLVGMPGA